MSTTTEDHYRDLANGWRSNYMHERYNHRDSTGRLRLHWRRMHPEARGAWFVCEPLRVYARRGDDLDNRAWKILLLNGGMSRSRNFRTDDEFADWLIKRATNLARTAAAQGLDNR